MGCPSHTLLQVAREIRGQLATAFSWKETLVMLLLSY